MKKLTFYLAALLFLLGSTTALAQNCTVNAGVDQVICMNSPVTLTAFAAGNLSASPNYQWTLLSAEAVTITTPNSLTSTVIAPNPGTYVFQFSAVCVDGITTTDSVTIRILPEIALPIAGIDQQTCTYQAMNISANAPPAGLTGQWIIAAGTTGVTIGAASNPVTTANVTSAGVKQIIWRISNGSCSIDDTMQIRVLKPATISAGSNATVSCSANCTTLNGSDPGITPQVGLWELVSGPSTPTFANPNLRNTSVCNLVPGVYTFRWNVSGPCVNGSATVVITVANTFRAPTVGNAVNYSSFCESTNTSSLVLKANGLIAGETGAWTQVSGPATPVIVSPTNSSTVVNGLSGSGTYQFRFTVNNANCASNVLHNVVFQEPITSLSVPADQELACNATSTTTAITYTGPTSTTGLTRNGALISGPITTGVTAVRSGTTSTDTWTLAGMTSAGKYVFRFEYRNACGAMFRDVNIYVSKTSAASNAGSNILLPCNSTSTALAGNNPTIGSGSWSQVSGPNTAVFSNRAIQSPNVSNLVEGTYHFQWTIGAGTTCSLSSDEVTVVKASTTVLPANAGTDITSCPGSVRLNGSFPGATQTGKWTVSPSAGVTFSDVTDAKATVSGLTLNSVHTFTWTISNACTSSSDAVTVTANANSVIPEADAGPDACLSSGTTLINLLGNSTASTTSVWAGLDGGSINNASSAVTTATVPSNGSYRFAYAITAPGCVTLYDTVTYTISAATSQANAGPDQAICAEGSPSWITLTAGSPLVGTGTWDQTAGDATAVIAVPNSSTTIVNNLTPGQYEFRYTISNGVCAATEDRVSVTITAQPTIANAGADIAQCNLGSGTAITLGANTASSGTGAWTVVTGPPGNVPSFSNAASPTSTISGLTTGTYVLRWTISTGPACPKSTDEVTLTVSRAADASATSQAFCSVNSVQLIGNANTSGTWSNTVRPAGSPVPVLTAVSPEMANAENLVTGNYTFLYTIPVIGSCASTSSPRTMSINTQPSVANAGSDIFLCNATSTVTLTGNVPTSGTGAWSRVSGPNTPTQGSGSTQVTLTNLVEGIYVYRYQVSSSGCTAVYDEVNIIKEKVADALPNMRVCDVTSVLLTANTPVYNTGSWSIVSGPNTPIIQLAHSPSTSATGMVPGTYVFRWTIPGTPSCSTTTSDVQVIVDEPVSAASAGTDLVLCNNSPSPLIGSAASAGTTYSWTPATYLSDPTASQPLFSATPYPGNYTYTLVTRNGSCAAYDQVTVSVKTSPADFTITRSNSYVFTPANAGVGSTYNWNFGSGANPVTASGIGPHTVQYNTSGPKTASLTVTDVSGCTGTKTANFTVLSVLPLRLLSFAAEPEGSTVRLKWKISDASNVSHFRIESSKDGINFTQAGLLPFSGPLTNYEYIDKNVQAGYATVYYRLVTVDIDAKFVYSDVLRVTLNQELNVIKVSPNPFNNQIAVGLKIQTDESSLSLKLYDMNGVEMVSKEFKSLHAGYQTLPVKIRSLSKGLYVLKITTNTGRTYLTKLSRL